MKKINLSEKILIQKKIKKNKTKKRTFKSPLQLKKQSKQKIFNSSKHPDISPSYLSKQL